MQSAQSLIKPEDRNELLIAKWNGEKWEAVAFGSIPRIAKKLGLIQETWAVGQDIKA